MNECEAVMDGDSRLALPCFLGIAINGSATTVVAAGGSLLMDVAWGDGR